MGGGIGSYGPAAYGGPSKGGKGGDWICPNCGDVVFASKPACRKCGTPKAAVPGGKAHVSKPGDWICPNCGDLVFATKEACRKCGTPKPFVDEYAPRYEIQSA